MCLNELYALPRFDIDKDIVDELKKFLRILRRLDRQQIIFFGDLALRFAIRQLLANEGATRECWERAHLWKRVQWAVRVRPYALHWLEEHAKLHYAPEGAGHARDRASFEAAFGA